MKIDNLTREELEAFLFYNDCLELQPLYDELIVKKENNDCEDKKKKEKS